MAGKKSTMLTARLFIEAPEGYFQETRFWVIRKLLLAFERIKWGGFVYVRIYEGDKFVKSNSAGEMDPKMERKLDALFDESQKNGAA